MTKLDRQDPKVGEAMSFLLKIVHAGEWVGEVDGRWNRLWAMPWEGWTKPNREELQAACALVGSTARLQRILDCTYMKAWYLANRPETLRWVDWRAISAAIGLNNPLRLTVEMQNKQRLMREQDLLVPLFEPDEHGKSASDVERI